MRRSAELAKAMSNLGLLLSLLSGGGSLSLLGSDCRAKREGENRAKGRQRSQ